MPELLKYLTHLSLHPFLIFLHISSFLAYLLFLCSVFEVPVAGHWLARKEGMVVGSAMNCWNLNNPREERTQRTEGSKIVLEWKLRCRSVISRTTEMNVIGKAPQHIVMHPLLELPKDMLAWILPQKSLSVLEFLSFKLPAIMVTTKHVTIKAFFSKDQPSLDNAQLIQDLPIPLTQVLDMLSKPSSEAIENGAFLLKCAHLTGDASKTQLSPIGVKL
ncbi:uncharacterized protein BJ212DRAFT_1295376 [Suillus subaureus]|uniref:Uncharacterized protein n=1 Tax=Suillus subaureus TaxID=48587 RepID=A0A9P7ENV1_9AGAM|nr:uncharacterized protein BJ212DRAFT_1295376 [Suillus subaureus]KAG1826114.1 hypothetical protein BJ212DRAFT_1295376 [Suillus subaureus]